MITYLLQAHRTELKIQKEKRAMCTQVLQYYHCCSAVLICVLGAVYIGTECKGEHPNGMQFSTYWYIAKASYYRIEVNLYRQQ